MVRKEINENGVKIIYGLEIFDLPEKVKNWFSSCDFKNDQVYKIKVFSCENKRKEPLTLDDRNHMIYRDLISGVKMRRFGADLNRLSGFDGFDELMFVDSLQKHYGVKTMYKEIMEG